VAFTLDRTLPRAFGKVIPIKSILPKLADLFNHTDKDVRKETTALTLELYRWVGNRPLASVIETLRTAQAKDLEAQFATVQPMSAQPERLLRSVMEQQMQAGGAGGVGGAAADDAAPEEPDPFEFMEEKDLLAHLAPLDEWREALNATKWSDRKAKLDELVAFTKDSKLKQSGDFTVIAKVLKKVRRLSHTRCRASSFNHTHSTSLIQIISKDTNIMVANRAIDCVTNLTIGLRQGFAAYSKLLLPVLLAKLKEKKPSVITSIHEALDASHKYCFSMGEVLEEVTEAVNNKVPAVRTETLLWFGRSIELSVTQKPRNRIAVNKTNLKSFMAIIMLVRRSLQCLPCVRVSPIRRWLIGNG